MTTRHQVAVRVSIAASAEVVWAALTDFGSYAAWHPQLAIESPLTPLAVGNHLHGTVQNMGEAEPFDVRIVKLVPLERIVWRGGDLDSLFGIHTLAIVPGRNGSTEYTDSEIFGGADADKLLDALPRLQRVYEANAAAFKGWVEAAESAQRVTRP